MKKYCVAYKYLTFSDCIIKAKNEKEAVETIQQVLPEVMVEDIYEYKDK